MTSWIVVQYSGAAGSSRIAKCLLSPVLVRETIFNGGSGFIALPTDEGEVMINLSKVDAIFIFDKDPR